MHLPSPRGPLSELVVAWLRESRPVEPADADAVRSDRLPSAEPLADEDLHLALWTCYELHYQGFEEVDSRWEWRSDLLALRAPLEEHFEAALRDATAAWVARLDVEDLAEALFRGIADFEAPSVAQFLLHSGSPDQMRELLVQRSLSQVKEADPYSFALPRLRGAPKTALAELLYDEYGAGRPERLHQSLFETTLEECGLDPTYGAYVDRVPGPTLAVSNAASMFGLHRRLRGALVGHLGAFEASSSLPSRKYADALRRLGFSDAAADYFDEHVLADAAHEQVALRDICARLAADHPALTQDVVFGAASCLTLDARANEAMLSAWRRGESSLLPVTGHREEVPA